MTAIPANLVQAQQRTADALPTRIVVATDIWLQLRSSKGPAKVELTKFPGVGGKTFEGLKLEMSHGLAHGEWFTHDRNGAVLQFNGNEDRIRLIARAYRTSRFSQ